jgi:methionyl-tRNA formyltransferase
MIMEDYAGVTLHYVDNDWDSGDIIDTFELPTDASIASEVYEGLAQGGKALLLRNFKAILNKSAKRNPQDKSKRQYKDKLQVNFNDAKYLGEVDLPRKLEKHIRALNFPGKQYPIVTIKGRDYEVRAI